jgi:hypothetical protein
MTTLLAHWAVLKWNSLLNEVLAKLNPWHFNHWFLQIILTTRSLPSFNICTHYSTFLWAAYKITSQERGTRHLQKPKLAQAGLNALLLQKV